MDDFNFSFVHKSLTRRVVSGSMPAHWLWGNIFISIAIGCFIFATCNIIVAFIMIIILIVSSLIAHIFLCKAYSQDEYYFSVLISYVTSKDVFSSTSRVNYIDD
jgi:hypothetical protein